MPRKNEKSSAEKLELIKAINKAEKTIRTTEMNIARFNNQLPPQEVARMRQEINNLRSYIAARDIFLLDMALISHFTFMLGRYSYSYLDTMHNQYITYNNFYNENKNINTNENQNKNSNENNNENKNEEDNENQIEDRNDPEPMQMSQETSLTTSIMRINSQPGEGDDNYGELGTYFEEF